MDKGKKEEEEEEEEVSKSLERSNNSQKKKRMEEETSDDLQKEELNDQMEQKARKRFKTTHYPLRLKLKSGSLNPFPKFRKNKETDSEETETDSEETDSELEFTDSEEEEEPSVISPAGSSTNKPKGMSTTKKILRELKKNSEWKSNSLFGTCTSTFRPYPTNKFPDSDKDESKKSPPVDQGSSCKKNL